MWRNGVVMAIRDIPATGIVAMDIVAPMVIHMGVTTEGTAPTTTGPITGAIITDTHMVDTTAGIEGSGLASIKLRTEEEVRPKRAGVEAPAIMSPLLPNFIRM